MGSAISLVKFSRLLGIDFGEKRLGVAISDPEKRIAFPLKVIQRDKESLSQLIAEYQVEEIIVGVPYSLNGGVGPQAYKALQFIQELEKDFSVRVVGQDERLSTAEARRRLKEAGSRHQPDSLSAAIILQSYLDGRRWNI